MALEFDPLDPDQSSGIKNPAIYKTSTDAYQNDVLDIVHPASSRPDEVQPPAGMPRTAGIAVPSEALPQGNAPVKQTAADLLGVSGQQPQVRQSANQKFAPGSAGDLLGLNQERVVETPEPKNEQGDFSRGVSVSGKQLKQTLYGTAALIGDTVGSDSLKEYGLKGYQDAEKEVQKIQKGTDSFTEAWDKGGLGKWLTYSAGYLTGQMGEMLAASGAGALIGSIASPAGSVAGAVTGAIEKSAVQTGIRAMVGKMIDKEAASLVTSGIAADIAAQQAAKSVYRTIGSTAAVSFLNSTQELGSIYGDAVEEAAKTGAEYSLGKVWLAGIAATAVDSWADSKALGNLVKSFGGDKAMKGFAMEALKGGFREGMTEGVQTAVERWGANKDLASQEAYREYIDSAAVGILGGSVSGGAAGAVNKLTGSSDDKTVDPTNTGGNITTSEDSVNKNKPSTENLPGITQGELKETLGSPAAIAFLYSTGTEQERQQLSMAADRMGMTQVFNDSINNEQLVKQGEGMLGSLPVRVDDLRGAIGTYSETLPLGNKPKFTYKKRNTEEDFNRNYDEELQQVYGDDTLTAPPALPKNTSSTTITKVAPDGTKTVQSTNESAVTVKPTLLQEPAVNQEAYDASRGQSSASRLGPNFGVMGNYEFVIPSAMLLPFESRIQNNHGQPLAQLANRGGLTPVEILAAMQNKTHNQVSFELESKGDTGKDIERKAALEVQKLASVFESQNPAPVVPAKTVAPVKTLSDVQLTDTNKGVLEAHFSDQADEAHADPKITKREIGKIRKNMEAAGFQPDDIERVVSPRKTESKTEVQLAKTKLADATANLFDVLTDATGAKMNITGQKYTVKDLPDAISKVMKALVDLGYVKFKDMSIEIMNRMRQSQNWSGLADKVTPFMLRESYNKLQNFEGKESAAEVNSIKPGVIAKEIIEKKSDSAANQEDLDTELDAGLYKRQYKTKGDKQVQVSKKAVKQTRTQAVNDGSPENDPNQSMAAKKKWDKSSMIGVDPSSQDRKYREQTGLDANQPASKEQIANRDVQKKLPVSTIQPKSEKEEGLRSAMTNLIANVTRLSYFKGTLDSINKNIAIIDAKLSALNSFELDEGKNISRFNAVDNTDDNPGMWALAETNSYDRYEDGVRYDKPTSKADLLAARRRLTDELEKARTGSISGQAALYRRSLHRIGDGLYDLTNSAIKGGMNPDRARAVFNEFYDQIRAMADFGASEGLSVPAAIQESTTDLNAQIDFLEGARVAYSTLADYKVGSISFAELQSIGKAGLRDGDFTHAELIAAYKAFGVAIPRSVMSIDSQIAVRSRMVDYAGKSKNATAARQEWLVSMDKVVGIDPETLSDGTFSAPELVMYELWRDARKQVKTGQRQRVTDSMATSNDANQAFKNLLFAKYSLAQMRNPNLIAGDMERRALTGTISNLEQAWLEDVAYALRRRPSLKDQLFDKEDGMLLPTDQQVFNDWVDSKKRAIAKEAELAAKQPYFAQLRNLDGIEMGIDSAPGVEGESRVAPSEYEKIYVELYEAEQDRAQEILDSANLLNMIRVGQIDPETGEILTQEASDQLASDHIDSLVLQSEMSADSVYDADSNAPAALMRGDVGFGETVDSAAEVMRRPANTKLQDTSDDSSSDLLSAGEDISPEETGDGSSSSDSEVASAEQEISPAITRETPMSLEGGPEYRFKKAFFSGNVTAGVVQDIASRIMSKWKSAPRVVVLEHAGMLPEPLRTQVAEKLGANIGAKGLYHDGTAYLFASHLNGEADVQFTLFHEVHGHLGLRAFLGANFDTFLENMYRIYPGIRKAADAVMQEEGLGKLEAIEEVLADMAGAGKEVPAVKSWVGKMIAGLREIGLGKVADWVGKLTNAELAYYLNGAKETAQNGGISPLNGAPFGLRLATAPNPYELFAQSGGVTKSYARFNPITQTWLLFRAIGDDIRGTQGYNSTVHQTYEDVLKIMRSDGKVERRKRSGLFVDDKIPTDFVDLSAVTDISGMKRWMRDTITKVQNEYKPVFDVVDYLKGQGRLTDNMDVKTALMLYERRTGAVVEDFRRKYVEPLMKYSKIAGTQGADYGVINKYLLARHAEERNKQIAKVNPRMPDGGSGMKNLDARNYLDSIKNEPYFGTLEEMGRLTDLMSKQKLAYQVQTGMITLKQSMAMGQYKHYVNLSGQNENLDGFDDPMQLAGGSKFNVKGKEARAMGRIDEASDILSRTILGMEAALIRGQKNLVAQKLLAMMEANYDPNFLTINEVAYKRTIGEDGMVTEQEDQNYIQRKDVMVAKVGGIPVTMRFKDASRGSFADAIHGAVYPPESSAVLSRIGRFNQIMGQMLTTWNPAWVAVNFIRDAQTMFFNAASDGRITKGQAFQMVRNLYPAAKVALHMATNGRLGGNIDPELVRYYNEMKREGGMTSFLNRKDLDAQVNDIHSMLGERSKLQKAGDKFKSFLDIVEYMTLPMEIAPRLAAYRVTRDNGMSKDEAAKFSGEITVNFNMRGSAKELRQLFLFFNPAVQGSAKMVSLMRDNPKKMAGYATAFIGLGMVANLAGRAFSDDDESGRSELDKVPVYKRATSIVIAPGVPGGSIPIPYGWNAFYALGHFAMDTFLGIQPASESAKRIAKTTFEAFTPMGTAGLDSKSITGTILKGIAPTAALPAVEWVMNENRYGAPIRKEGSLFGGATPPDSESAFRSVSPISQSIARGLNEITGGNKAKSGAIDVNPAAIDFLINSYMPGLVNESYKGASMAVRAARGEEVKDTPLPLIDRFTAKVPDGFDAGSFRRAKEMTETRYNEFKLYPENRDAILQELPGLPRAHAIVASATQEIRKLNSTLAEFERKPNVSEAELVERKNMARKREKEIYNRAVKSVMEAGPQFREAVMAND